MSSSYGTARYKERNKRQKRTAKQVIRSILINHPIFNQSPNYQIPRLPNSENTYPFSTGLAGSDDHSLHDPA